MQYQHGDRCLAVIAYPAYRIVATRTHMTAVCFCLIGSPMCVCVWVLPLCTCRLVTVSYIPEKPVMQVLLERVKVAFATPEGTRISCLTHAIMLQDGS